ncbi:MAG: hypothetical protein WC511_01715 [Candidatus Pacearchaeota archaeon]
MSVKSWKKEFYKPNLKNPVASSLLKWEGALKKNLKKHDVIYGEYFIGPNERKCWSPENFLFGVNSCPLCQLFFYERLCGECPIKIETGKICDGFDSSVYLESRHDPKPMIRLLRKLLKKGYK